jgi:PTH1 family peptidyl-tRNA hydrolase
VRHLVVGLGNPGPRYAPNRHNVGFLVLDELARSQALTFDSVTGNWEAACGPAGLVLLRPLAYMNRSGEALAAWAAAAGVSPDGQPSLTEAATPDPAPLRPLVICDDLALPLGSVRLRVRGSSGGQKGLASIIEELGGGEFPRMRLGIAPVDREVAPTDWADFVLEDFAEGEHEAVAEMVRHAADGVLCWREEGLEAAINRFNRRRQSPPPAE